MRDLPITIAAVLRLPLLPLVLLLGMACELVADARRRRLPREHGR